jgi:DNA polymerase III sliding clamp (beta) subunit (PCNA family)
MRVETQSGILSDALNGIRRAVAGDKSKLDVLRHVHIAATRGAGATDRITVTGTNLELAIRATIDASVPECGEALIPFAQLREWIALDDDAAPVTLACDGEDDSDYYRRLSIASVSQCRDGSAIRNRATFCGINPADFPAIPQASDAHTIGRVAVAELVRIFTETVAYCAPEKSNRPALSGVCLSTRAYDAEARGWLHALASDGARASLASCEYDDTDAAPQARQSAIIPAYCVKAMLPILKDCEAGAVATLSIADNGQLMIDVSGIAIVARSIDYEYPQAAILGEFAAPATAIINVNRVALDGMLARALAVSEDKKETFIRLRPEYGRDEYDTDTLYCETATGAAGSGDSMDCYIWRDGERDGEALPAYTYNARYIADAVKSYPASHGTGKNKSGAVLTLALSAGHVRIAHNDSASRSHTLSGERIVCRVYTKVEADRRAWQRSGAVSSWRPIETGDTCHLAYMPYGVAEADRPQHIADSIALACGREHGAYAATMAHIDSVMAIAWDGYAEAPLIADSAYTRDRSAQALSRALAYHAPASPQAPGNVYPNVADYAGRMADYHAAIVAYGAAENAAVSAMYARIAEDSAPVAPAVAEAAPVLLLAARSIVRKSQHPYGLPIAEDASSAEARRLWREYSDARALATRIIDCPIGSDAPCIMQYGERLAIHHYRRTLLHDPASGRVHPYPEEFTLAVHYRDGEARCTRYSHHATLGAAFRTMMAMIPARAIRPPGMPLADDATYNDASRLWISSQHAARHDTGRLADRTGMFAYDASGDASAPAYAATGDSAGMFEWRAMAGAMAILAGASASPATLRE